MKALAIVLVLVVLSGCAGTESQRARDSDLVNRDHRIAGTANVPQASGQPFGNLSRSFLDHLADCGRGLDFTQRSLARTTADSVARAKAFFE